MVKYTGSEEGTVWQRDLPLLGKAFVSMFGMSTFTPRERLWSSPYTPTTRMISSALRYSIKQTFRSLELVPAALFAESVSGELWPGAPSLCSPQPCGWARVTATILLRHSVARVRTLTFPPRSPREHSPTEEISASYISDLGVFLSLNLG